MSDIQDNERNESTDPSFRKLADDLTRHANLTDPTSRPGFKEALRLRLREALAARPSLMTSRLKLLAALSPVLVVLIIAVLVFQPFVGVRTVYAYDQFTLTPESEDALGVAADTAYVLESRDPVSASDIEKLLVTKTRDSVGFDVQQVSDTRLRIAFDQSLRPDEVVQFSIPTTTTWPNGETATRDYRWAYQVKGDFRVVSTIPGNLTSQVPLDSGIEFDFNLENVSEKDFERALTISPPVNGHVESSRRSFVFVPDELQPETVYTVTLSGGLSLTGSDETLGEDYTFTFETDTDAERGVTLYVQDRFLNVVPDDQVMLTYDEWSNSGTDESVPHVRVFRFAGFDDYVAAVKLARDLEWRSFAGATEITDTSVPPAYEFDVDPVQYGWQRYLPFPMVLPAGYYVAEITSHGAEAWAIISSSDLTAYVSRATNKTLFWVNDAATGDAVAGADVRYSGDDEHGTTNHDGLAYVSSVDIQDSVVEVRRGNDAIAVLLRSGYELQPDGTRAWSSRPYPDGVADNYWTYVYTDRPTYRPTDTVKFWGYVESRDDGSRPSQVRVDAEFDAVTVDVTPNGTYSGELSLRGASPSYYTLTASWNGTTVATRTVNVSEYVKPSYTLSIEPDVDAAFVGDSVGYTVHGEFFEGTPVNGLEVYVSGECGDAVLTLDDAGNARGSFACGYDAGRRYPTSQWFSVRPNRSEEGDIEATASVMMFGPKVYLDTPWNSNVIENGVGTIEATVRNTQAINSYDPAVFGPTTRSGQTVNGTITEISYLKHESGQSYDFVRKQVVMNYWYERVETEIGSFSSVSDENGNVRYGFAATNPEANYRVKLSSTDEHGRTDETEVYLWEHQEYESGDSNALSFHNDDAGPDQWDFPGYAVGEQVHLLVYQKDRPYETPDGGRFLYYQAERGIRETETSSRAAYSFPFEQTDVPNVSVYGVLFYDGAYQQVGQMGWWYGTSGFPVSYDASLSKLDVTVTPDRTVYAPGVDAKLSVHVQDADGKPVSAEVNLNVVDEAYYALFPETVDPLSNLYRWVDDGVVVTQVTRSADTASLGAEKGGGGDRALGRYVFKDTAAFELIQTDDAGNGTMAFTLPDNITSWRVTAQALDSDGKRAGDSVIDLAASRPFFLNPVMRDSYLDADQPTLLLRAAGTQVGLGETVSYEVQIPDASYQQTFSASAGDTVLVDLPNLDLGTHNVTISGTVGALEDKLTRTVDIVPSRLVRPVVEQSTADAGDSLDVPGASDRYTRVTFMDGAMGRYYGELQTLAGWWGDRADEALARQQAGALLSEWFGEASGEEFPSVEYVEDGVRLLPYADPDFDLTAKVALLGDASPIDGRALARYFYGFLDGDFDSLTQRERAMTLAALASLGEPVLAELQRAAPDLGDDVDVRLWVALGLHGAGDDEAARSMFRGLARDAKEQDGYVYLEAEDPETTVERTALAAVLAGALNEPDRDALHDYVLSIAPGDTTVVLDRLLYVRETIPNLIAGETQFSYTVRGKRTTTTLAKGDTVSILVAPDERSALDVSVDEGSLVAVSRYETPVIDPAAPVDASLGIRRAISTDAGEGTSFTAGQLVKIQLSYELPKAQCGWTNDDGALRADTYVPCESYEITDVLPSGLSVVSNVGGNTELCNSWPAQVVDQRVSFFVTWDSLQNGCDDGKLTYYARVVTPGTYLAEPAYIRSVRDPETNNHSDAAFITIHP